MRIIQQLFIIIILFGVTIKLKAQETLKVAIFAPIYLDSAFKGNDYKLGNNNLPKNMLAGLDFYNGVMMAIDSMEAEGKSLEVLFYDSKGGESIYTIIRKPEFENVNLIIASFNNKQDIKPLAEIALHRKIPLISSTYPNDGGVTDNPYFVLLNSSLKTHAEEIYKYLQKSYSSTDIFYIRRKGSMEDLIQYYFNEAAKNTLSIPINYKTIDISDTTTASSLLSNLDSNKRSTIICGSLNESFGVKVVKMLASDNSYDCTIIGMPTWDGLKELDNGNCSGVNIVYSTPYNFVRSQPLALSLSKIYKSQLFSRPSDMFFKGYESMYHFGSLLIENPTNLISHLSDRNFKLFNDFNIVPLLNKTNQSVDYLENKKLYFIKKLNGNFVKG